MKDNVVPLDAVDSTGVRRNVAEVLEHLRKGDMAAVTIMWRLKDKDKTVHTFWNGDSVVLQGMLAQAIVDLSDRGRTTDERTYDTELGDDDDSQP